MEQSGKLYKYFYSSENNYEEAKKRVAEAIQKGYINTVFSLPIIINSNPRGPSNGGKCSA
jgi:hypothetical protein